MISVFHHTQQATRRISLLLLLFVPTISAQLWNLDRGDLLQQYAANPKPVIAVDLDETVMSGTLVDLLWLLVSPVSDFGLFRFVDPFPRAAESLHQLSSSSGGDYYIIFVTARPAFVAAKTMEYLDQNQFPPVPLFTTSKFSTVLSSVGIVEYKSSAVQYVRDMGLSVVYGIGDAPTDILAFAMQGSKTILILENAADGDLGEAFALLGTQTYPSPSSTSPGLDLIIFGQDDAWDTIVEYVTTTR